MQRRPQSLDEVLAPEVPVNDNGTATTELDPRPRRRHQGFRPSKSMTRDKGALLVYTLHTSYTDQATESPTKGYRHATENFSS